MSFRTRLAKICHVKLFLMETRFGNRIRELRVEKNLFLRQIAAKLEVDTSIISKVERGERSLKKNQIEQLAKIFDVKKDELFTLFIADQLNEIFTKEPLAKKALELLNKK